jgi:signal transduction histidine kinase
MNSADGSSPLSGLLAALAVFVIVGASGTYAWTVLQRHEIEHTAETIETGSYAARADLVKELQRQFYALRMLADFWSDYGHLSPELWDDDAQIELQHFEGFETIMWDDPERDIRYVISANGELSLRNRPDDSQWEALAQVRKGATNDSREHVLGRSRNDAGHFVYRLQIPARGPGASGSLIAAIDADRQLHQALTDSSPGFAIQVLWDGDELYSRDAPATDIPGSWRQGGLIQLPAGPKWEVIHTPTADTAENLSRPTMPGLLAAIWAIAFLFGLVVYLYGRVLDRVASAEAAQSRYAALNTHLEKRVDDRTSDLMTISQSVVHDIRGSLNTIALSSQALRSRPPSATEGVTTIADRIEKAIGEIQTILERTNAFGQVANAEMHRETVDMRSLVERLCHDLVDERVVSLSIGDLPSCNAQPLLVEILWHNLIENAVKFSRESPKPVISIDADSAADPVVYRISDNGPGFDSEKAETVFKPFIQLESRDQTGQGMGLTLVARIVERHDGTVTAESEAGAGARFSFDLGAESSLET